MIKEGDIQYIWDEFINGYCKVEFLCYGGEPNWLGWVVMIGIGLSILGFVIGICSGIRKYDL